jgi:hypothetical protein
VEPNLGALLQDAARRHLDVQVLQSAVRGGVLLLLLLLALLPLLALLLFLLLLDLLARFGRLLRVDHVLRSNNSFIQGNL